MSSPSTPLISLIMPVFNAGPYLRPAVESVLAQTCPDWELIVVDDGSTDDCMATIRDLEDARIHRIGQANAGKPAVMNRALKMARGRFWAVQDADDLSYPQRLELQSRCLIENPDVAAVFCGHDIILEDRTLAPLSRTKSREECAREIGFGMMPAHDPTAMFRADMVRGFEYSEDLPIGEGLDFIMRVGEAFPMLVLGSCLYSYRIVNTSLTRRDPLRRNALVLEMVRRMCTRRGISHGIAARLQRQMARSPQNNDNGLAAHFTKSVADQVEAGQRWQALRTGLTCWRLHPWLPTYAKPFVYAMFPRSMIRAYRQSKWRRIEREWTSIAIATDQA